MSSELFENFEFEINNIFSKINKLVNTQLPNYNGGIPLITNCVLLLYAIFYFIRLK